MRWFVALLAAAVVMQSRTTSQAAFEVASVKPNSSGSQRVSLGFTPGGYTALNVPLRIMVVSAYGVRPAQAVGGPAWVDVNRFDIVAKAAEGTPREAMMLMLRALLADRFKLAARLEMREQAIYALVLSRSDRRGGPQLKTSTRECAVGTPTNPCRISGTIGAAAGSVVATGQTMADLAAYLGQNADRLVVDRTGLQGRFDFELAWTAETLSAAPATDATPASSDRAGLFTAVQEQLGLNLEPARGPVPFVVIDHAELPAPD